MKKCENSETILPFSCCFSGTFFVFSFMLSPSKSINCPAQKHILRKNGICTQEHAKSASMQYKGTGPFLYPLLRVTDSESTTALHCAIAETLTLDKNALSPKCALACPPLLPHHLSAPNRKSQIASDLKSRSPNRKNFLLNRCLGQLKSHFQIARFVI